MHYNQLVNVSAVVALFGGNKIMAFNLVRQFIKNLECDRSQIEEAYTQRQEAYFIQAVHRLAGAAAYAGTEYLFYLAKELEQGAIKHGLDHMSLIYQYFLEEVRHVQQFQIPE